MGKKAIILGSTGLVGSCVLKQLLENKEYAEIITLNRRPSGISHTKLKEHLVDFEQPATWQDIVRGDVLFSCLGTTIKAAGSKQAQYRVDYTYQFQTAQAAAANGVQKFSLVSSAGADSASKMFYSRIKGELDENVQELDFKIVRILRPSLLVGKRVEKRAGEELAYLLGRTLLPLIPGLRKYKPIPAETVARALINSVEEQPQQRVKLYELMQVFDLANQGC